MTATSTKDYERIIRGGYRLVGVEFYSRVRRIDDTSQADGYKLRKSVALPGVRDSYSVRGTGVRRRTIFLSHRDSFARVVLFLEI